MGTLPVCFLLAVRPGLVTRAHGTETRYPIAVYLSDARAIRSTDLKLDVRAEVLTGPACSVGRSLSPDQRGTARPGSSASRLSFGRFELELAR